MKWKIIFLFSFFLIMTASCGKEGKETYTIEIKDGVKYVHNHAPLWGDTTKVALEFVQQFGKLESEDENYLLYRPNDVVHDSEGNIYILEMGNVRIQKFDRNGAYIMTIGRKGAGPGEFSMPAAMSIDRNDNLFVLDVGNIRVQVFSSKGKDLGSHRLVKLFDSFRILSDGRLVVSNTAARKAQTISNLINVIDLEGSVIYEFGTSVSDNNLDVQKVKNTFFFDVDQNDNCYLAYKVFNKLEKFSPEGKLLFSADRPLNFKESSKPEYLQFGSLKIPFLNEISRAVHVDGKKRIWVLTYTYPLQEDVDKIKEYEDLSEAMEKLEEYQVDRDEYEFHIFNEEGIFLGVVPTKQRGTFMRIYGERAYVIDRQNMIVNEYKIVEK